MFSAAFFTKQKKTLVFVCSNAFQPRLSQQCLIAGHGLGKRPMGFPVCQVTPSQQLA